MTFEEIWQHREETIYPELFGEMNEGIYILTENIFIDNYGQKEIDPRWLTYGVMESKPNQKHKTWLYITSGMSNPWEAGQQKDQHNHIYSGLGIEFVIETNAQANWAVVILQKMMAYNILMLAGRFGEAARLDYGARISLNQPLNMDQNGSMKTVIVTEPSHYPVNFELESGVVDLLHFIGVTDEELAFAQQTSTQALIDKLKQAGVYPITDPARASIV